MTMEHCPRQECPSTEAMKIGDYKCHELGIATRAGCAVVECLGCCLIWYQPRGTFPAGANAEPIGFVSADRTKINPVGDRMRTRSDRTTDH